MKQDPILERTYRYLEGDDMDPLETGDSVIAVLSDDLIASWLSHFDKIATTEDAQEYCEYATTTQVFDIDGQKLVVVCDSGGEFLSAEFEAFCDENDIESQFIIDSLDCTDVAVEDIYTGMAEGDNMELLALVHKIYN